MFSNYFLEIVLHILKLVLLGFKTIITNPRLELIGHEQRPIAALIKSFIISNLTYNGKLISGPEKVRAQNTPKSIVIS